MWTHSPTHPYHSSAYSENGRSKSSLHIFLYMHEWIYTPILPEKSPNRKSQNKKSFHGGCFFLFLSALIHLLLLFLIFMKISCKFGKKIHFSTAAFEEGKMILAAKTVREAPCMRWILNIILKEVCIRRRTLMLIFKHFHISSWACQVDNYMHWPMCLECYPDRDINLPLDSSDQDSIKSHMSAVLFFDWSHGISEDYIFHKQTRISSERNSLISALVFYI